MVEQAQRTFGDATGGIFLDPETLHRLKTSTDSAQFAAAWLAAMAGMTEDMRQGLVVLSSGGRARFEPAAIWPDGATASRTLMEAVDGTVKSGRTILQAVPGEDGGTAIACPVTVNDQLRGAVAVLLGPTGDDAVRLVMDQLQWATGWVEALVRRRRVSNADNLVTIIELLATGLHHERFQEAAAAVATELAGALGCERVAISFVRRHHCRVRALSNSASFGRKANLIRAIEAAMDEAADQQAVIVYPPLQDGPERVLRAHEALAKGHGAGSICTVPLTEGRHVIGAMLLERGEGEHFDRNSVQLCEHAGVLLGPTLNVKRLEDRWLPSKALHSLGNLISAMFGPRHGVLKLCTLLLIALVAFFYFAKAPYRVAADAVIEGRIQRAVTAPIAGYLTDAETRAGDIVAAGQLMAQLDTRDLRLERLKWASQKSKLQREYSEALAKQERTRARILKSEIEQGDAQLALLDDQIERMSIRAPFEGIVVSGDLTQAIGAPVERGDVLFEVAPLNDYRVMLKVDERDVADLASGQSGHLVLSAMPDRMFSIRVERITPISTSEEGRNFFMVEAALVNRAVAELRPGMEGVGKIEVDERRLVWIWTRKIVLWARMFIWSWWP